MGSESLWSGRYEKEMKILGGGERMLRYVILRHEYSTVQDVWHGYSTVQDTVATNTALCNIVWPQIQHCASYCGHEYSTVQYSVATNTALYKILWPRIHHRAL
jgi:hypothetical protein